MREPWGGIASLALLGTTLAPAPSCCRGPAPVPMQPLDGGDIQQAGSLAHEHMTHEQWQRMALSSGWTPGEGMLILSAAAAASVCAQPGLSCGMLSSKTPSGQACPSRTRSLTVWPSAPPPQTWPSGERGRKPSLPCWSSEGPCITGLARQAGGGPCKIPHPWAALFGLVGFTWLNAALYTELDHVYNLKDGEQ